MAGSSLDPDNLPVGIDRVVGSGHGTGALGPSDSSDSGSDLRGAPGLAQQVEAGLATDANADDPEESTAGYTAGAGADAGDANLDSDTLPDIEAIPPDLDLDLELGLDLELDQVELEADDVETARRGQRERH